jgi:hypothetical protein
VNSTFTAGPCEHGNETSGFMKGGEFIDQLSNCELSKKEDSVR